MTNLKKPEEYLESEIDKLHNAHQPYYDNDDATIYDGDSGPIFKAIQQAQREAYNRAIDDAVESAELQSVEDYECADLDNPTQYVVDDYENYTSISKQSILKLKIK